MGQAWTLRDEREDRREKSNWMTENKGSGESDCEEGWMEDK